MLFVGCSVCVIISLRKMGLLAILFVGLKRVSYLVEKEGASCYAFRWFVACV